MTDFDKKMEKFFDIQPKKDNEIIENEEDNQDIIPYSPINIECLEKDFKDDYIKARENYHELIEKGKEAIDEILEISRESESPRAFEVAAVLLKNVLEANEKMIDIHRKIREISDFNRIKEKNTNNIKNALFVGSTAELSKILKELNGNIIENE